MTPAELREALDYLSEEEKVAAEIVARELGVSTVTIRNWLQSKCPISTPAAVAIMLLCELHVPLEPSMTREELDEAIDELYDYPLVSQRRHHLAVDLGVSSSTVKSWRDRRRLLQGPARAAIQLMLKKKRSERRTDG